MRRPPSPSEVFFIPSRSKISFFSNSRNGVRRYSFHDLAGQENAHALITESRARRIKQGRSERMFDELRQRRVRAPQFLYSREACRAAPTCASGDRAPAPSPARRPKIRDVLADRIAQRNHARAQPAASTRSGNGLGDGGDQVHRIGACRRGSRPGRRRPIPPDAGRSRRAAPPAGKPSPALPPATSSLRSFAAVARPAADIPAASGATGFNCAIAVAAAPRIDIVVGSRPNAAHARISRTTFPATSVSRKSRPL